MNLAIRSIGVNLDREHANSFHHDLHPVLKADYVMANPPFSDSGWQGHQLRKYKRWKFGASPAGNSNFAWGSISSIIFSQRAWPVLFWPTAP